MGALLNLSSCSQGDTILGGTERRCCPLPLQPLGLSASSVQLYSHMQPPSLPPPPNLPRRETGYILE